MSPSINYNRSTTSLRPDVITNFYTYSLNSNINFYLPKKYEWGISCNWNNRAGVGSFAGNTNTLVNLYASRKFLANDQLEAHISVIDLFNQNIGFERNANSNYVNEQNYLVLKRYVLFGLKWNISSNKGGGTSNE